MKQVSHGTSIKERIEHLVPIYKESYREDNISKWTSRKSLCTEKLFEYSLTTGKIGKNEFNIGIKELNDSDMNILNKTVNKSSWYILAEEILAIDKKMEIKESEIDFSYAIRFHLQYFANRLNELEAKNIMLDDKQPFMKHLTDDLIEIVAKTLVYDLHVQKKKRAFEGASTRSRFIFYMKTRFESKQSVSEFFEEYPVLMRLLSERVSFAVENYQKFYQSIDDSISNFQKEFKISAPYTVSDVSLGAGDSHSKGKTVVLFKLNEVKFAFKEKNLVVGSRFNQFLDFISEKTGKEFKQVRRITKKNYTFEEFIEQKDCQNEKEIEKFYTRFGEYIALVYLLRSNDFHFENLVAHGEFPTLIDIETIIQNDNPLEKLDNPFSELGIKKYMSILSTALIPMRFQENRIEPLVEGVNKGIRMSAFDGKEQMLPFKVLGIVNPNTDEVRYEYMENILEGSNNIPFLSGKEVDSREYVQKVVEGFESMSFFFIDNKEIITKKIEELFSNVLVRNVIKSTQKYCDMLSFGYHPKCMKNYIEREKLFENLWFFAYQDKAPIQSEITDMLINDVPIFFNNTSSRDLIASDGKVYENYYSQTAVERVVDKIRSYDLTEFRYQDLRLKLAFEIYEEKTETFDYGDNIEDILHRIVGELYCRAKFDTKKTLVTFEDFTYEKDGELDYSMLLSEFYDGLSGIYLFLLYYVQHYNCERAFELKGVLEKQLFKLPKKTSSELSVYSGKYAVLYPLLEKIKLEKQDSDITLAKNLLEDVEELPRDRVDWVSGVSGVIKVLVNYFKLTQDNFFLEKAINLAGNMEIEQVSLCGFSHGFSGIAYALHSLYVETGNVNYLKKVRHCIELENEHYKDNWPDLRNNKETISQWCHGTVGIGYTRLLLKENGFDHANISRDLSSSINDVMSATLSDEAGLCHGELGRYSFLEKLSKSSVIPEDLRKQINIKKASIQNSIYRGVTVNAFENNPALGLMTGITGVGYALLRTIDEAIPDVLTLEL